VYLLPAVLSSNVNLGEKGKKDVTEEIIKGLNFKAEEEIIEEREGNNFSLKQLINKIKVYDIELNSDLETKEGWICVKGVDLEGQIINKKYLLKNTDKQQPCLKRLRNLEEEMFQKFANHGKFFL
jgi:hypothetical protein